MEKARYLCLHDIPLFSGIDQESFLLFCKEAKKLRIKRGEFLFNQGDPSDAIYLLQKGSLKLVSNTESGGEIITQIAGAGEILGQTAMFRKDIYAATSAIALEESTICFLYRQSFESIVVNNPQIALKIIKSLGRRLDDTWRQLTEFKTQTVHEKIISLFIQLAEQYGEPFEEGTRIKIHLTQQEIASVIGSSRVMVSQVLHQLMERNEIRKRNGYYELKRKCIFKM